MFGEENNNITKDITFLYLLNPKKLTVLCKSSDRDDSFE